MNHGQKGAEDKSEDDKKGEGRQPGWEGDAQSEEEGISTLGPDSGEVAPHPW